MGSLQSHEARINRKEEKIEEKAFQVKGETNEKPAGRGRGRGGFRGKNFNNSRGGGRSGYRDKSNIQCHNCKKFGHMKAECWFKEKQVNFAEESDGESKLFMAYADQPSTDAEIWFVDSGCSNHMTRRKSIFIDLDETQKKTVRLGDDKEMTVEGKGTVAINIIPGKTKILDNVELVNNLAHNLLSVCQIMESGYSVLFDNRECVMTHKASNQVVVRVPMTKNKMFPFDVRTTQKFALVAGVKDESKVWHLRYGHLNINGLQLLEKKGMVFGLPKISALNICEGCIYGKQTRMSFPVGKAWRATKCLELVHSDLYGPMQTKSLGGSYYFLLFIDDFSRMSWIYFLKS